ncbi:MAG: hypothetical protein EOP39_04560 [Rubrivivax sp.]|nr:MAG: hypothetical protein EOP39_04560 [Rubrivivax sp.]
MALNVAFILGCAWLAWCLFNVGLLFVAPYLIGGANVVTNGFSTVFPQQVRDILTLEQQAAIQAHEDGHKAHRHALKNLLRSFLLLRRPPSVAMRQELEADCYAADLGHAQHLASALRVLSADPFDRYRAGLLDRM